MRILIDTNGDPSMTTISINGEKIEIAKEFHVSIHYARKVKLQMVKEIGNKTEFISYYGDDFKKMDEFNPPKK
jgi:hypothetical protein